MKKQFTPKPRLTARQKEIKQLVLDNQSLVDIMGDAIFLGQVKSMGRIKGYISDVLGKSEAYNLFNHLSERQNYMLLQAISTQRI